MSATDWIEVIPKKRLVFKKHIWDNSWDILLLYSFNRLERNGKANRFYLNQLELTLTFP